METLFAKMKPNNEIRITNLERKVQDMEELLMRINSKLDQLTGTTLMSNTDTSIYTYDTFGSRPSDNHQMSVINRGITIEGTSIFS